MSENDTAAIPEEPEQASDAPPEDDIEVADQEEAPPVLPNRYNVSSYGWDSDVEGLVKRLKRQDIYVPGFQRGFVWTSPEKSRFIESLILGLPVPNIFLAQDATTKSLNIVDGQQRLRTLWDYLDGRFYLAGNDIQPDLRGCYFSRDVAKSKSSKVLEPSDARTLADAVLHAIVIKPDPIHDDPKKGHEYNQAIIQIFKRLNTSGKPLQAQEIRMSIFHGPFERLLSELNEDPNWRELFGKPHSRLKDVELILRFFALNYSDQPYKSPMPAFLDTFMESSRELDPKAGEGFKASFHSVAALVKLTIGRDGLRSGNTLTVSRYDAIMAGFLAYLTKTTEPDPDEIKGRLTSLEADKDYLWSIDEFVNDTDRVTKRLERARAILGA